LSTMRNELEKIYKQDQADRLNREILEDFKKLNERDCERRKKVAMIVKKGKVKTGRDLYFTAMVYQHGPSVADSKKAIQFAKKSMESGHKKARWLFAATTDRLLVKQKRKQKFGTQFSRSIATGKVAVFPINERTTDEERELFGVPTLKEIKQKVKKLNQKNKRTS